jgi:uncharacterized protein (DUF3820 family)
LEGRSNHLCPHNHEKIFQGEKNYMELKFGKHKGKDTSAVPTEYLQWLLGLDKLYPKVRAAVQAELAKRQSQPKAAEAKRSPVHRESTGVERGPTHAAPAPDVEARARVLIAAALELRTPPANRKSFEVYERQAVRLLEIVDGGQK